jgi:hypothetical protein
MKRFLIGAALFPFLPALAILLGIYLLGNAGIIMWEEKSL